MVSVSNTSARIARVVGVPIVLQFLNERSCMHSFLSMTHVPVM